VIFILFFTQWIQVIKTSK